METRPQERGLSKTTLVLVAVALGLILAAAGWWTYDERIKTERLNTPAFVKKGMTRAEVEAILQARITDERTEGATGDLSVAYVVEHRGLLSYTGFIVDVRFDGQTGKVKRVEWSDPRE